MPSDQILLEDSLKWKNLTLTLQNHFVRAHLITRGRLEILTLTLGTTPFSTLKLACLNGKFLTSDDRYTSMTFDWKILRGVRRQVLYSHHANCTAIPWGSLSLLVIPLALVNGLPHWPVIKWCLSMFDLTTFLTWIGLYLEWRSNEFEDPGSSFIHPGYDIYSGIIKTLTCRTLQHRQSSYQRIVISAGSSVYHQTIVCPMYIKMNL